MGAKRKTRQSHMGEVRNQARQGGGASAETAERARPDARHAPWHVRRRPAPAPGVPAGPVALPMSPDMPTGIERRLPRRAELLWNALRGKAPLPPAEAAGALLAPPFATLAILVTMPIRGAPQIAYAGSEIGSLGPASVGPARADARPQAPIPDRLVALSLAAIAAAEPMHLDSDFDPDTAAPGPGLLFRAVALPLAPDPASGLAGLAVAVLSWRKLLSHAETEALHLELRAAMSWLGSGLESGGGCPDR